jgi:hypothetical protein
MSLELVQTVFEVLQRLAEEEYWQLLSIYS